ncbi:YggT family protein [Leucobacter sp. CSA1]|uniref:YggT family protein n=1 Tax=Leucobacter chromiisoli TaxID=2796471 RepID=A0A934Q9E7_9MICO|nr:YggT family protein [Leucobacter chromiisoli]MBK0419202.1 YggT family protein [Leucobacter chromiisoli]
MGFLALVAIILRLLLQIYIFILWGRFVLDWIRVLNRRFRPTGPLLVLVEAVYTVTDPPIRMFRRILPPIRIGQIALDLGWPLTLISCIIVSGLLGVLIR